MQYFKYINDKIVYTENDIKYHTIQNKSKFGAKLKQIEYKNDFEKSFLENVEADPNIIFWNYKSEKIKYTNPLNNKIEIYKPLYMTIYKENNETIKTILFDVEEFNYYDTELMNMNENDMSEADMMRYQAVVNKTQILIEKYQAAKKYCEMYAMNLLIITNQGVRAVADLTKYPKGN